LFEIFKIFRVDSVFLENVETTNIRIAAHSTTTIFKINTNFLNFKEKGVKLGSAC
jgi:hypothetical protein